MAKLPVRGFYLSVFLLIADIVALVFLFHATYAFRIGDWDGEQWMLVWPVGFTLLSLYVLDAYRADHHVSGMRAPVRTIMAVGLAGMLSALTAYAGGYWGNLFGRGVLPVSLLVFAVFAAATRYGVAHWAQQRAERVCWLVLGAGETAELLWKDFRRIEPDNRFEILARDESERREAARTGQLDVVGTLSDLDRLDFMRYSGILLALSAPLPDGLAQALMRLRFRGINVYDLSDFYERFWSKVPVMHLRSGWLIFSPGFDLIQNPLGLRLKRVLDRGFSATLIALLAPLLALIAVLIRLDSPGPVIFRQQRVGEGGRVFTLYKFRSMRADAEQNGAQWASAGDPRITRLGRILRTTRLDELPQLWNVLRGDMSFIGPRPERPEFTAMLEKQIPYYDSRYLVKPGITGWAQVLYPYGASADDAREKLQYDLYYIKHYSLLLDIAIVFKTIRVVLLGRGR
jgi:sugar transferase (PEP-CTERM system associated)